MIYLTETRLKDFIHEIFRDYTIIHNKKLYNVRPDFYLPDLKLIIEFDGYLHFTKSKTYIRDTNLNKQCKKDVIKILHIPYFIQLDEEIYELLFGSYIPINENIKLLLNGYMYPHGFIDKKAILPSDFCLTGLKRFEYYLEYYKCKKRDIITSLNQQIIQGKNVHEVFPEGYFLKWNEIK